MSEILLSYWCDGGVQKNSHFSVSVWPHEWGTKRRRGKWRRRKGDGGDVLHLSITWHCFWHGEFCFSNFLDRGFFARSSHVGCITKSEQTETRLRFDKIRSHLEAFLRTKALPLDGFRRLSEEELGCFSEGRFSSTGRRPGVDALLRPRCCLGDPFSSFCPWVVRGSPSPPSAPQARSFERVKMLPIQLPERFIKTLAARFFNFASSLIHFDHQI